MSKDFARRWLYKDSSNPVLVENQEQEDQAIEDGYAEHENVAAAKAAARKAVGADDPKLSEYVKFLETKIQEKDEELFKLHEKLAAPDEQSGNQAGSTDIETLRTEATTLGIEYRHNTGAKKLKELIEAKKAE